MQPSVKRSSSLLIAILVTLSVLLPTAFREAPLAQGTSVPLTVRITRVIETDCDEGLGESCPNDYFSKVNIDGQGLTESPCCAHPEGEPPEFSPNDWVFSRSVPIDRNPVAIHFQLWDQDDGSFDNPVDIANGGDFLDLTFDLNTCTFQGAELTARQGAGIPSLLQGQSEGGDDDSARIYFTITTPACITQANTVDTDGDGLFNGWEVAGIDGDTPPDGPDLFLNTDPTHKDLFVEVDWMECSASMPPEACVLGDHSHKPADGVLDDVITSFRNAPVVNPDGTTGVTLHAISDEAIGERIDILFKSEGPGTSDDFNDIKLGNPRAPCKGSFGTAAERSSPVCEKILRAKRLAFRYMIFAHSFSEKKTSSGSAEIPEDPPPVPLGGNDFIVTLGNFDADAITFSGGQRNAESGTFMHEFGHNLALRHGGGDNVNCKPNYLSVMNYTLQFQRQRMDPNRPLDYSRGTALPTLNENGGLDENAGVSGPPGRLSVYGLNGNLRRAQADASIDWNGIGGLTTGVTADVNRIAEFEGSCDAMSLNPLLGYDDWSNIKYNFRDSPGYDDGATRQTIEEITAEVIRRTENPPPDLKAEKSVDKATAVGGATLNYTVKVTNLEPPKAFNVSVTDTLPNGITSGWLVGALDQGASHTQTFPFLVPCTAADGAVLTNSASVTGANELGYADVNLFNNTASASTTVQAPKLTLSKTATASVNAGEAITYTITYQNTGTGGAANIVITDTLPASVYYSTALDTGGGPKPTTVTVNGDGTRTLVWNVGALASKSGNQTIEFTARPTLLAVSGTSFTNNVTLSFKNENGCTYLALNASATTSISAVAATLDPLGQGWWRTHPELATAEILARIQATDQRYDGLVGSPDGALSAAEANTALAPGGNMQYILREQLIALYFNLATRRVNADTPIASKLATQLGLTMVRDAAIYAIETLKLPVVSDNRARYSNATDAVEEINLDKSLP